MQLDLKEKQFSPDNTFPGSLHFPLLIKTLSYVLIIHLNHKCLRLSLLYTTKRQLIMWNMIIASHYFDNVLSLISYSKTSMSL